ncbi:MAG: aldehyde dehydrogenase family protein, partial [Acidobacteria bacterium]|nr:aldehyde dehydrogenase family protein [Acidobacteriota bacterium]
MPSEANATIEPGRLYIGGQWVESASGATFKTINPTTERPLAEISEGRAEDIDRAVKAARAAFTGGDWPKMSPADRGRLLWRVGDLIESHLKEIAEIETLDSGKTITEAGRVDVPMAADCFRYFAGWATKIEGETIPVRASCLNYTI